MIPFRSPSIAAKKYVYGYYAVDPLGQIFRAAWEDANGIPATARAAPIPSIGHAGALTVIGGDPQLESTFTSGSIHLTPSGKTVQTGEAVRYPRYVYVVPAWSGLQLQLATNYSGGYRVAGGPGLPFRFNQNAAVVPIVSASLATSPEGIIWPVLTGEEPPSQGGELFIAIVQQDWNSWWGAYASSSPGGYSPYAISSSIPVTGWDTVENAGGNRLLLHTSLADYDRALALPHIETFKKFKQVYYVPNDAISTGSATPFTTTGEQLFNLFAPAPYYGVSVFPAGDAAALAAQILADATAFFS